MAQTRQQAVSGELRRLAARLAAHRKRTSRGRRRIPEAIWDAAVALAERDGVNPVARGLGLDYYSLKQRVLDKQASSCRPAGAGGDDASGTALPEFVEVCVGGSVPGVGWSLAFEDGSGRRLTLRAPSGREVDVAALAEVFWRRPG